LLLISASDHLLISSCLSCRPLSVGLVTLTDLLEAKADPNIADNAGRTALSWAVTNPSGMGLFTVVFSQ